MSSNSETTSLVDKLMRVIYGLHDPIQVAPLSELLHPLENSANVTMWAEMLSDRYPVPVEILHHGTLDRRIALSTYALVPILRELGLTTSELQHQARKLISEVLKTHEQQEPQCVLLLDCYTDESHVRPGFMLLRHSIVSQLAQALIALFAPHQASSAQQCWSSLGVVTALRCAAAAAPHLSIMRDNWRASPDLLAARKDLAAHLILDYYQRHVSAKPNPDAERDLWTEHAGAIYEATAQCTGAPLSTVYKLAELMPSTYTPPPVRPTVNEHLYLMDSPAMHAWLRLARFLPNNHRIDPLHLVARSAISCPTGLRRHLHLDSIEILHSILNG